MSYYYLRNERRWLSQNDSNLLEDLQNNLSFEEICSKYNKPAYSVRNRILQLALLMINEVGLGLKVVSMITKISEIDLQTYVDLIERKKNTLISKL